MTGVYADLKSLYQYKFRTKKFSFLPKQPVRSLLSGPHGSRLRGRGLNFEEIRAYQPGDDIRSINWKVTARTGKPHTQVYSEDKDKSAILLVDQRTSMFFGSQLMMKSVAAAELAAIAAWRVLEVGDRIGAIIFGDTETDFIKPQKSEKNVLQILKSITEHNTALNATTKLIEDSPRFNEILKFVLRSVSHDTLIIIISDLDGANEESQRLITSIAQHNNVIISFVSDPLEKELNISRDVLISDLEKQLNFGPKDTALTTKYRAEFEDRLERAKGLLLKRRIPLLQINTEKPILEQLNKLLGGM